MDGIRLFNAGQYWRAHEALEAAWREEPGAVRDLYRGILQHKAYLTAYLRDQIGKRDLDKGLHLGRIWRDPLYSPHRDDLPFQLADQELAT